MATAAAVADPVGPVAPPATESTAVTAPAEPAEPTENPPPEVTEPPRPAAPAEELTQQSIQDIKVTATFGKASYRTGEKMTITVTVRNTGTGPMTLTASFFPSETDGIQVDYPSPFEQAPFTVAAGASVTHDLTGVMANPDVTTATLYARFFDAVTGIGNQFPFSVPVTQTFGHVSGTVYFDRNHNGKFDAGEGRSGITMTWVIQRFQGKRYTATTDSTGRFAIDKLPTGAYYVDGAGDGLKVGFQAVDVGESGVDGLVFRAVGPLTGLTADLEFTKETYARNEAPFVRVTLTNSTDEPLIGIVANCDRGGFGQSLDGRGPGWGDLAGDGVTIAAHSTLVVLVTEPMPAAAYEYGHVSVGCDFSYKNVDDFENAPHDSDRAAVPGQRGDLTGTVAHDDTGIAGVRLVLVPETGGCAVGETRTDAQGEFAFRQVPVGDYDLFLFPPSGWHAANDNPTPTYVVGTGAGSMYLELDPGDAPAPTLPSCPAAPAPPPVPTPQARPAPHDNNLADTGASIAGPFVAGALALLTGTGAVLASRRRRPPTED